MSWPLRPQACQPALRFGVIGWPVGHSLSPAIHRAAFDAVGSPHTYEAIPVEPADVSAFLDDLKAHPAKGSGRAWGGVNVTIPHKKAAARAADRLAPAASALGAANVLLVEQDAGRAPRLLADNTDAAALLACLRELPREPPASSAALVLGAGGAARAALWALARYGARRALVGARSVAKARATVQDLSLATEFTVVELVDEPALASHLGATRLVINATPVGLADPSRSPLPDSAWRESVPGGHVLDLVYGPARRRLQEQAESHGWTYSDGLGMLVRQAALSWRIWFDQTGPEDVMRAAAAAAVGIPR